MNQISFKISKSFLILSIIIFMLLALSSTNFYAKEIKSHEVGTAVETWVRHITTDARPKAEIERLEPYQVAGKTMAYIAHLSGGGFCLCGADELVLPVYFYSPEGKYDPQNPNYQYILWEIETRSKTLQKLIAENDPKVQAYQASLAERSKLWEDLKSGIVPPKKINQTEELMAAPDMMVIDFTPHWHQGRPYNDQCPELTPGVNEHTAVGCVATAMAQIMYYWKWPDRGEGQGAVNYTYRWRDNWDEVPLSVNPNIPIGWLSWGNWANRLQWTATSSGRLRMNGCWDATVLEEARKISTDANYQAALNTLYNRLPNVSSNNYSANFGATTYNWNLMQDWHDYGDSYSDDEVAKLCFHAGVAVGMNYGLLGSGAEGWKIPLALRDRFSYDTDVIFREREIDKMTEDIQFLRPVILGGDDPLNGGHAWVIYGYDKSTDPDRLFRMNLGWGESNNFHPYGWYSCDHIDCTGKNGQPDGRPDFYNDQVHVTRIAPENVKFVGGYGVDGSPDSPYSNIDKAISHAPDHSTLIFKAGGVYKFSANTLVINRPLTLKGYNVTISK